jgi:hypothetical protein
VKTQFGRPRHTLEAKISVREIGWYVVEWIHLAHDRDKWRAVVNTVMNMTNSIVQNIL